jgi:hypothetical protein
MALATALAASTLAGPASAEKVPPIPTLTNIAIDMGLGAGAGAYSPVINIQLLPAKAPGLLSTPIPAIFITQTIWATSMLLPRAMMPQRQKTSRSILTMPSSTRNSRTHPLLKASSRPSRPNVKISA